MLRPLTSLGAILFTMAALHADPPTKLSVSLEKSKDGKQVSIAVGGLDKAALKACADRDVKSPDWEKGARVQLGGGSAEEAAKRPALMGTWRVENDKLLFEPRFPFLPGSSLRVTIDPLPLTDPTKNGGSSIVLDIKAPKIDQKPVTKIEHIFPTRKVLPENQLRFYIHFSQPMSRGDAYEHIRLLDAKGKPIDDVFLELGEELWDPSMKRFTLLFHPGRVKTGLQPREELGPILENGKSYSLVLSGKWPDAEGRPLIDKEYRKDFTAGPAADEAIDPKMWKLLPPSTGQGTLSKSASPNRWIMRCCIECFGSSTAPATNSMVKSRSQRKKPSGRSRRKNPGRPGSFAWSPRRSSKTWPPTALAANSKSMYFGLSRKIRRRKRWSWRLR